MSQRTYEVDMLHGPIFKRLIAYALPLMATNFLQLLFNAVDTIVVGRFSGSIALAAVGSTTSLINVITNLFTGISIGVSVLVARYYALEKEKAVSDVVHTSITLGILCGIVLLFVGIALSRIALSWMDTPDNVIDQATLYMRIYCCSFPFFIVYAYGSSVLRAVGDTKRPLMFLFLSGGINVILNLILVIVFQLGVAGVGIASVVSQAISCFLVLACLHKCDTCYRLDYKHLTLKKEYVIQMSKIGIPAGLQSTIISFSNVLLQSSVNSLGSIAMAGSTAANNLFGFMFITSNAVTQSCMNFMSQNYAVKAWKRMDRIFLSCLALSFSVELLMGSLCFFKGDVVLSIYSSDADVIACGQEVLLYTTLTYFLCSWMDLLPGAMRGVGYSTLPTVFTVLGTVGSRIIWIVFFFPLQRTLSFLYICYPLSWIVTLLMQITCAIVIQHKKKPERRQA